MIMEQNQSKEIRFSDQAMEKAREIIGRYPEERQKSALIPLLHLAQSEFDGWLNLPVLDYVASVLNIKPIEVYEVATFYSMFNLEPVGKCLLEVCHTGPCWLNGAEDIVQYISARLGIGPGETTSDGMFTLKTVECLGSCGSAPMLQCGADYYENLTEEKVDRLIEELRASGNRSSYLRSNQLTKV